MKLAASLTLVILAFLHVAVQGQETPTPMRLSECTENGATMTVQDRQLICDGNHWLYFAPSISPVPTRTPQPTRTRQPTRTPLPPIDVRLGEVLGDQNVNVRSCPNTSCSVVTTIVPGDAVKVIRDFEDWYELEDGNFIWSGLVEISNECTDLSFSYSDGTYRDPHEYCKIGDLDEDMEAAVIDWEIIGSSIWLGRYSSYYTTDDTHFVKVKVYLACLHVAQNPCSFYLNNFLLISPDFSVAIDRDYKINSDVEGIVRIRPGGAIHVPIRFHVPIDAGDYMLVWEDFFDNAYFQIEPTFN